MYIESVIPSNHLILCHPLLLLPSIFPSIGVFSFFFLFFFIFKVFIDSVTILLLFHILLFVHKGCGILAPFPGIKPAPLALGGEVLTAAPSGKFQVLALSFFFFDEPQLKAYQLYVSFLFFFFFLILFNLTLQYCIGFAIYQNESATGIHVFPILNPPPSSLPITIPRPSGVFSNESVLHIRWLKYCSFSFSISPSNEHPGLFSFRTDWLDLLAVQGTLKSLLQHSSSKALILRHSVFFRVQLSHPYIPGLIKF